MDESWADGNLYEILGVPETATQEEIKRSYHTLARQYHPDKNPDDPQAAEKCKAINNAYRTLGDETKRHLYDLYRKLEFLYAFEFLMRQHDVQAQTEEKSLTKCDKAFIICCGLLTGCYCCCFCCFFCCGKCMPSFLKDDDDDPRTSYASSDEDEDSEASEGEGRSQLLGNPITTQPKSFGSGLFQNTTSERTGLVATVQTNYATLSE